MSERQGVPQAAMKHALDRIAHDQGYGDGERERYRSDDELMVEMIYPSIRDQVLGEVKEAVTSLPRFDGDEAGKRGGLYVELTATLQSLNPPTEGPRRTPKKLEALALLVVDAYNEEFGVDENDGRIDAEASMLPLAIDVAAVFARDEPVRHALAMLPDPGACDYVDEFRAAFEEDQESAEGSGAPLPEAEQLLRAENVERIAQNLDNRARWAEDRRAKENAQADAAFLHTLAAELHPGPEDQPLPEGEKCELERYRAVFGDLCWTCGGSGEKEGAFDDQESGGLVVCPDCNGKGTK